MNLPTSPPVVKRIAITLGLGVAFVVMASIFVPERSPAGDVPRREPRTAPVIIAPHLEGRANSTNAHQGLNSLGTIESGRYSIVIYATAAGPRYTIIDSATHEEIGTLLTAQQVQQLLPEIELKTLDFSAPSDEQSLMLVNPPE